jgi:hypothetical protein
MPGPGPTKEQLVSKVKAYLEDKGLTQFDPNTTADSFAKLVFDVGIPAPLIPSLVVTPMSRAEVARVIFTLSWWLNNRFYFFQDRDILFPFRMFPSNRSDVAAHSKQEMWNRMMLGKTIYLNQYEELTRLPHWLQALLLWQVLRAAEEELRSMSTLTPKDPKPSWSAVCNAYVNDVAAKAMTRSGQKSTTGENARK